MYGLSAFFCGEQRVAAELGPIMRAVPDEDMRIFLCTQIADEARHVAFFDRFYSEVGVLEADTLAGRLEETVRAPEPGVRRAVRRAAARARRPAGARARGHRDAGRGDHDLPHGRRGDAGADRPALHHRLQREGRDAAGLRRRVHAGRARRAPPRRVRRALPARHGAPRRAPRGGDPARAGGGRAGRRRRAAAEVVRGLRRGGGAARRLGGGDARVRADRAGAAPEGDRARRSPPKTLPPACSSLPPIARRSARSSPECRARTRIAAIVAARRDRARRRVPAVRRAPRRTARTSCARSRSRSTCATRTRCARSRRRPASGCTSSARTATRSPSRRSSCPAYEGDVGGVLPIVAARELEALKQRFPTLEPVEEGKARINKVAGYSLAFRADRKAAALRPARAAPAARRQGDARPA